MSRTAPTVYLSGPIGGHTTEDATDWREEAMVSLNRAKITAFSPLRNEEYIMVGDKLPLEASGYGGVQIDAYGMTVRDKFDARTTDLMIANFTLSGDRPSFGTMIEIGWADAYGVPIIVVINTKNIHNHPMLLSMAGYIVNSIEDAVTLAKAILLP